MLLVLGVLIYAHAHLAQAVKARLTVSPQAMLASPVAVPDGYFDESGTIVIDGAQDAEGMPYLLYTVYDASGNPSIMTKQLIFQNESGCAANGLPCASPTPPPPVSAGEHVGIQGTVQDQSVIVTALRQTS